MRGRRLILIVFTALLIYRAPASAEVAWRPLEDGLDLAVIEDKDRLISGWSWNRADYSFIFKNNKLIQWGAGQVRQATNAPQILILYRLR